MFEDITLFIPTHDRHRYLDRILSYYSNVQIKILVADSTDKRYSGSFGQNVNYLHLPGSGMPQKMAKALASVDTEFVVMCADDDFIIPDGISDCLHFLKQNRDFAAAQGNCIGYKKDTVASERISFSAMYTEELSFQIVSTDPFERLRRLFNPYRTIFCAVHYTKNLGLAYNEKMLISNLFLNEYVSGIIPIVSGKFAELPVFYQVREFAEDSADKTTDNFDMIVGNPKYKTEYEQYLEYIADLISSITGSAVGSALEHVKNILNEFAESLRSSKMLHGKISFKKKIGLFISQVPFIGKALILKSRDVEKKQKLSLVVKSARDKDNLNNVEVSIRKYANAIQ